MNENYQAKMVSNVCFHFIAPGSVDPFLAQILQLFTWILATDLLVKIRL